MGIRFLFGDETNATAADGDFFIYGAIAVTPDAMLEAHNMVAEIRDAYGFARQDSFKFHTRSRPADMDRDHWTAAKTELLQRAADIDGLDMFTYVIFHDIARGSSDDEKMQYALNVILSHFDLKYLRTHDNYGVVSVDRHDNLGYDYLERRFSQPLDLPGDREVYLDRTLHLSQTCDGASHMSSLVDIALGAFRYCVNTTTGNGREEVARPMFQPLVRMMWQVPIPRAGGGTRRRIGGYGFLKYPKVVKSDAYRARYTELSTALARLGVEPEPEAE